MKHWYLVQTKSRQEEVARQNLINQSFETYLPRIEINGKFIPLFTKYIFLKLDDKNQNWSPVRSTKGVSNFVRFGLKFATIPNNVVKAIKAQESDTIDKFIDLSKFHKGDKVEILEGPLKGQVGLFDKYNSDKRIVVLFKILQQKQFLVLDESSI
jgi:transcriptional antiterminator RfaH